MIHVRASNPGLWSAVGAGLGTAVGTALGNSPFDVGVLTTATLLGSAGLTLLVGMGSARSR